MNLQLYTVVEWMSDTEVLNSRSKLFLAVGSGYEKMGKGAQAISGAINGTNIETLEVFKGMFVGRVSMIKASCRI